MTPKELNTLVATASLNGINVRACACSEAVRHLSVSRGNGPQIKYLMLKGDKLLRLYGSVTPDHDPLPAEHWHPACNDLANELEALVNI
jgi:hypothetical protein